MTATVNCYNRNTGAYITQRQVNAGTSQILVPGYSQEYVTVQDGDAIEIYLTPRVGML